MQPVSYKRHPEKLPSDGNFTGAAGILTLDGLGVLGAGGHTLEEHLLIDSLVSHGRLLAGLLATIGRP